MRLTLVLPPRVARATGSHALTRPGAEAPARTPRLTIGVLALAALGGLCLSAPAQSQAVAGPPAATAAAPATADPSPADPGAADRLPGLLRDLDGLLRLPPTLTIGRADRRADGSLALQAVTLRWGQAETTARQLSMAVESIDATPASGAGNRLDVLLRGVSLTGTAAGQPIAIRIRGADLRGLTGFRLDAATPETPIRPDPAGDIGWSEARIEGLAAEAAGLTFAADSIETTGFVRRVFKSLVARVAIHTTAEGTRTRIDQVSLEGFDVDLLQRLADGAPVPVDRAKSGVLVARAEVEGLEQTIGDRSTHVDRIRFGALAHKPRLSGGDEASLADRLNIPVRFRDLALDSADLGQMTFKGTAGSIVASAVSLKGLAYTGFDSLAIDRVVVDDPGSKLTMERFQADDVDFGTSAEPTSEDQILYSGFKVEKLQLGRLASEGPAGPGFDLADAELSMRYPVGSFPTIFRSSIGRISVWPTLLPDGLNSVLKASGHDALTASAILNLSWQDVQEEISIDGTEIRAEGLGDLSIGAVITGIPRGLLEDYAGMVGEVRPGLRNLSLLYTDKGLTDAIIDSVAADAGLESRALKERIIASVPFVFESIPDKITRSRFAFALASFVNKPGMLRLTSGRTEPVPLETIRQRLETSPQDLPDLLRLELTAQ